MKFTGILCTKYNMYCISIVYIVSPVSKINQAVLLYDGHNWLRACVMNVDQDTVTVHLVDSGEEREVKR